MAAIPPYAFIDYEYEEEPIQPESKKIKFKRFMHGFTNWKRITWLGVCGVIALAGYTHFALPQKIYTTVVKTVTTTETISATGKVRGQRSTDLGLDVGGVIKSINVEDGQLVKAGTSLLSLDFSDADTDISAAQATVRSAQAELAKAKQGSLPSEINEARAELEHAQSVGSAKIQQAQAHMRDIKAGARSQEIAEANAQLASAKVDLDKAQRDYKRTKILVDQGAVAKMELDNARSTVSAAQTQVTAQEQKVSLLKAGPRANQLSEAQAGVAEVMAERSSGVKAAREKLNTLLAQPRPQDVRAAQAKVDEAQAELSKALHQRNKPELRAPFDGVVGDLAVELGQSVTPGQKLMNFQEISRPIIEVETDEENLSTLITGQNAVVSADAYPGKTFDAVIYDLGSQINTERGTVKIKLRPVGQVSWLRPDLTVDVNIITQKDVRRIMLPPDSITKVQARNAVLMVKNDRAIPVYINTGATGPKGVVVFGDIKDGDIIARNAVNVKPFSDVRTDGGS